MDTLGVAEAKRRFSELSDRVAQGEIFIIAKRGKPRVALVPPELVGSHRNTPAGLASVAGLLTDWDEIDKDTATIVAARRSANDRPPPFLD